MTTKEALAVNGDGEYWGNIRYAARQLTDLKRLYQTYGGTIPDLSDWIYHTQYASGSTIWRSPSGKDSVLVTTNGNVHFERSEP